MILSDFELLFNDRTKFQGIAKKNEILAGHCTMHVGGLASLFLEPQNMQSLVFAIETSRLAGKPFFLLGGGSNVVFPDEGLELVICTRSLEKDTGLKIQEGRDNKKSVLCSAGSVWGSILSFCRDNNLGGLEPFTSLSGTAGGAVFMNASCFGRSVADFLVSAAYLDTKSLEVCRYEKKMSDWGYKKSPFQCIATESGSDRKIIISAEFSVSEGFDSALAEEVRQKRISMGHFRAASAGSVFKNNPDKGIIAGKLIDECGLKGFSIGGAQIAPWHGNFIINPENKATSSDIKALVEHIQKVVVEKTGIFLEKEIIFA